MKYISFAIALLFSTSTLAQQSDFFSSIHPIEPIARHYESLSKLDEKAQQNAALDQIAFQKEKYNSYALMFTIAEPAYLTRSQIKQMITALTFPANSSNQTRAELDFLLDLQQKRTKEEVKRVMTWAKVGYWPAKSLIESHPEYHSNINQLFFECQQVIGEKCTAENYPKTAELLKGVTLDMRMMEFSAKYHLLRARPYQLEPKIE
ncbi:MAG: hypothetical protein AAF806_22965, partial [Bacteroidota bacterium]